MTLDEKIGQLVQQRGGGARHGTRQDGTFRRTAGPRRALRQRIQHQVLRGDRAGCSGSPSRRARLGIPLLIGADVIHGFRTIFPINLAVAASWDPAAAESLARVSAREASAMGIHWTFSPMCDVSRDPRWGRVSEGAGEDPYLARVSPKRWCGAIRATCPTPRRSLPA